MLVLLRLQGAIQASVKQSFTLHTHRECSTHVVRRGAIITCHDQTINTIKQL